jgi:hypothetical protein
VAVGIDRIGRRAAAWARAADGLRTIVADVGDGIGRARLVTGQRPWALYDPDVVVAIHGDAADLAEQPIVRQRIRPVRYDLETRRDAAIRRDVEGCEPDEQGDARCGARPHEACCKSIE